jgi:hypothetical protein
VLVLDVLMLVEALVDEVEIDVLIEVDWLVELVEVDSEVLIDELVLLVEVERLVEVLCEVEEVLMELEVDEVEVVMVSAYLSNIPELKRVRTGLPVGSDIMAILSPTE